MRIVEWLDKHLSSPMYIDLARVQFAEREERRLSLNRELSGEDAQHCMERVQRRMMLGDTVWIPPMFNREVEFKKWKRRHRARSKVHDINQKKEA